MSNSIILGLGVSYNPDTIVKPPKVTGISLCDLFGDYGSPAYNRRAKERATKTSESTPPSSISR